MRYNSDFHRLFIIAFLAALGVARSANELHASDANGRLGTLRSGSDDQTALALSNLTASVNSSLLSNSSNSAFASALEHLSDSVKGSSLTNAASVSGALAQVPKWSDLNSALSQLRSESHGEVQSLKNTVDKDRESGTCGTAQLSSQLISLSGEGKSKWKEEVLAEFEKRGASKSDLEKSRNWSPLQLTIVLAALAAGIVALVRSWGPSRGTGQMDKLASKHSDLAAAVAKLESAQSQMAALQSQFATAQPQLAASLQQSLSAIQAQVAASQPQLAAGIQQSVAAMQAQLVAIQHQMAVPPVKS